MDDYIQAQNISVLLSLALGLEQLHWGDVLLFLVSLFGLLESEIRVWPQKKVFLGHLDLPMRWLGWRVSKWSQGTLSFLASFR